MTDEANTKNGPDILDLVADYVSQGLAIFPCRGKTPLIPGGFKNASKDPATVKAWWTKWPDANIGMATGAISGFSILDVDVKNGVNGWDSLKTLEAEHGALPTTRTSLTPSGGAHLWFSHADGWRCTTSRLGPGLDTRGDGGYVIIPPSKGLTKGAYAWKDPEADFAEAPAWVLEGISKKRVKQKAETPGFADLLKQAATATEGARNKKLYDASCEAGRRVRAGLNDTIAIEQQLLEAATAAGLPADEAQATIKSGMTAGSTVSITPSDDPEANDLKGKILAILQTRGLTAIERKQAITDAVIFALHARGDFYYEAGRHDFETALYFDRQRGTLCRLMDDGFNSWVSRFSGLNRAGSEFAFVFASIQDEALNGKTTGITPRAYWHGTGAAIYLSNGDGRLAKITPGDVQLLPNGTDGILFPVGRTLPEWILASDWGDPFEACRAFRGASYAQDHGFDLFRLWAVSLPTCPACKPLMMTTGPIGSGKTEIIRCIMRFFGLPERVAKLDDNYQAQLWTQLDMGGLVCVDNADTAIKGLADDLAAAATAGVHEKRQLYTDSKLVTQRANASLAITSANPTLASDAGLADRTLNVRLTRRTGDTAQSTLWKEIDVNRDAGLTWMCWALASALADAGSTPDTLNKRHPDFASFAVRIGRAIGREGEVIRALRAAEEDKSRLNLQSDEIGLLVSEYMGTQKEAFEGTALNLLDSLKAADPTIETWRPPLNARRLGKRLARIWPHLEARFKATSWQDRKGFTCYRIEPLAEYAEFPEAF